MAVKSHTQQIAKAAGAQVVAGKRNERIRLGGKTIGVLWTRASGAIALYVDKAVKVNGNLKKQTDGTNEGLRLRLTKEQVEAGELGAAEELVKLAAATVATPSQSRPRSTAPRAPWTGRRRQLRLAAVRSKHSGLGRLG